MPTAPTLGDTYYRSQRRAQRLLAELLAEGEKAGHPPLLWRLATDGTLTGEADTLTYDPAEQREAITLWADLLGATVDSRVSTDGAEELYAVWKAGEGGDVLGCFRAIIVPGGPSPAA